MTRDRSSLLHAAVDLLTCLLCFLTFLETRGLYETVKANKEWRVRMAGDMEKIADRMAAVEGLVNQIQTRWASHHGER